MLLRWWNEETPTRKKSIRRGSVNRCGPSCAGKSRAAGRGPYFRWRRFDRMSEACVFSAPVVKLAPFVATLSPPRGPCLRGKDAERRARFALRDQNPILAEQWPAQDGRSWRKSCGVRLFRNACRRRSSRSTRPRLRRRSVRGRFARSFWRPEPEIGLEAEDSARRSLHIGQHGRAIAPQPPGSSSSTSRQFRQ